jgi:hypothetical protein
MAELVDLTLYLDFGLILEPSDGIHIDEQPPLVVKLCQVVITPNSSLTLELSTVDIIKLQYFMERFSKRFITNLSKHH